MLTPGNIDTDKRIAEIISSIQKAGLYDDMKAPGKLIKGLVAKFDELSDEEKKTGREKLLGVLWQECVALRTKPYDWNLTSLLLLLSESFEEDELRRSLDKNLAADASDKVPVTNAFCKEVVESLSHRDYKLRPILSKFEKDKLNKINMPDPEKVLKKKDIKGLLKLLENKKYNYIIDSIVIELIKKGANEEIEKILQRNDCRALFNIRDVAQALSEEAGKVNITADGLNLILAKEILGQHVIVMVLNEAVKVNNKEIVEVVCKYADRRILRDALKRSSAESPIWKLINKELKEKERKANAPILAKTPPRIGLQRSLLLISEDEWKKAEAFFAENPNEIKMKKSKSSATEHSFIRIPGNPPQIFAMASFACYGEEKHARLGSGSFGLVKVVQNRDGENFAVKIEGRGTRGESDTETQITRLLHFTLGEAQRELRDEFGKKTEKKFKGETTSLKLYTIMELIKASELHDYIYSEAFGGGYEIGASIDETQKLIVALKACKAIQELHDFGIIHADIKAGNFLTKIDGTQILLRAIDFGLSKRLRPGETTITGEAGAENFRAPEVRSKVKSSNTFSLASDIYALGVLFQHMELPENISKGMLEAVADRDNMETVMQSLISELQKRRGTLGSDIVAWVDEMQKKVDARNKAKSADISWDVLLNNDLSEDYKIVMVQRLLSNMIQTNADSHTVNENDAIGKALLKSVGNGHRTIVSLMLENLKFDMNLLKKAYQVAIDNKKVEIVSEFQRKYPSISSPKTIIMSPEGSQVVHGERRWIAAAAQKVKPPADVTNVIKRGRPQK